MDRFKLEKNKKSEAELKAELDELKAELKKLREERTLPAKVTKMLPEMEKIRPYLVEASRKQKVALREEYSNCELPILRFNSQEDPCCTAASPPGVIMVPAFSEDGEGKEA